MTPKGAAHLDTQILAFLVGHDALVTGYEKHLPMLTNHPKDRHVLATAITAGSTIIVTFNLRDFPPDALSTHGVTAVHPDVFLLQLLDEHKDTVRMLIRAQSEALRSPPLSVAEVLQTLAQHIPLTVARLQDDM